MVQELATLKKDEAQDESAEFDFDALEERLQGELNAHEEELKELVADSEKIGSPDEIGKVITNVVWEQFMNQVASKAGEDFVKANRGLPFDPRTSAHVQSTADFAKGKIATHNTEIDYQKRYDNWQANFVHDEHGNVVMHPTRMGTEEATLVKGARADFDKGRPAGNKAEGTDMDHEIPAAKIIRDPAANAHLEREEQVAVANSKENLYKRKKEWNRSKGDKTTPEWLDNANSKGQKPKEIFGITDEEEAALRRDHETAKAAYEKKIKEGEERSIKTGRKSQRQEIGRMGMKALRAALMTMLAALLKKMIARLVQWFKSAERSWKTLWNSLCDAIHSFIGELKTHLKNAGASVLTAIATAIFGPIVRTINKVWILFKQGWSSLKEAVAYLKNPANRGKSISIQMMEVGKLVIAGLTAAGALALGEVIEKGLMLVPGFAVEIPLLGSLANLIGIFLGAVIAGIIGALAINALQKKIAKKQKEENLALQIDKSNEVLVLLEQQRRVSEAKLEQTKENVGKAMEARHQEATHVIRESVESITRNTERDASIQDGFDKIDKMFGEFGV